MKKDLYGEKRPNLFNDNKRYDIFSVPKLPCDTIRFKWSNDILRMSLTNPEFCNIKQQFLGLELKKKLMAKTQYPKLITKTVYYAEKS